MTARLPGRWTDTSLCQRAQSSRERGLFFLKERENQRNSASDNCESEAVFHSMLGKPEPRIAILNPGPWGRSKEGELRIRTATDIIKGANYFWNHFRMSY
jgi:hypothetical protein